MRRALNTGWWVGMLGLVGIGVIVEQPGVAVAETSSDTAQILIIIPERSDRASTATAGGVLPTRGPTHEGATLSNVTRVTLVHDGDVGIVRYTAGQGR